MERPITSFQLSVATKGELGEEKARMARLLGKAVDWDDAMRILMAFWRSRAGADDVALIAIRQALNIPAASGK